MRIRISPRSDSTVGFFFQLLFHLVFIGAGCYALGSAYVQYQQGAAMQQVYVMAGVGAAFVLFSGWGIYSGWRKRRRTQSAAPRDKKHEEAPWRVRPEWRSNEFVETSRLGWGLVFFALVWNAFSWPMAGYVLYDEWSTPGFEWPALLILMFPAFGILAAWDLLRKVLHRRKFGTTTLIMDDMPGRLGEPLRLRLRTGVKRSEAPEKGFRVRLSCYRRSVRYVRDSDGDRRRKVEKDLLWQDEKRVRGRTYGNGERLEVPVVFDLPVEPPPSTPQKRSNRIMWKVEVYADLPGLDFQTDSEIPVFEPEAGRSVSTGEATALGRGDGMARSGRKDDASERIEHARSAGKARSYEKHEVGTDFTEPESDGITMQRSAGGGLQLHFAPGRNRVFGAILTVLTVILGIVGYFALAETLFGALIMLAFAGLTGYGAWSQLTTASTLTIENGTITLVRGPFGRGTPVTFPCSDLTDVSLKINGSVGSKAYYALLLHRREASNQREVGAEADEAGRMQEMVQDMVVGLAGANSEASQKVKEAQQNAANKGSQLKVASGLKNKQEADWIAATIQEAARHEAQFA